MLSPFRWDNRFIACIINSPVYFNKSHLDWKKSPLSNLCSSTNGQLIEINAASTVQVNRELFCTVPKSYECDPQFVRLVPSILIQVKSSYFGQQQNVDMLSIVVPLNGQTDSSQLSQRELVEQYYSEPADSSRFYPYPEQRSKRSIFPLYQLRSVAYSEREPIREMLEKSQLPYDQIDLALDDLTKASQQAVDLLVNIVSDTREQNGDVMPFLFGEDNHVYGMIYVENSMTVRILFFPPDFPLLMKRLMNKQTQQIVEWIQTIPLEYVPPVYAFLNRSGIHLPFPCPTLPSRDQCK